MTKKAKISENEFYHWILKRNKEQIISNRFLIQELFLLNSQFLKILQVKIFFERKNSCQKSIQSKKNCWSKKLLALSFQKLLSNFHKNSCHTKNHSWPPQVFFRFWKIQYCKKKHSFCWKRKFVTNLKAFMKIIMTKLSNCQKLSK